MTSRRLISEQAITDAEAQIAKAVALAVDDQRRSVKMAMRSHGLTAAAVPVSSLWSQTAWAKAVNRHVGPVASAVAAGLASKAKAALGVTLTAGAAVATAAMSAHIVDTAMGAGARLGAALANAAGGSDAMAAVDDALDSGAGWVGDMAGRMAVAVGNWVTSDLAQHAAAQTATSYTMVWCCAFAEHSRDDHMDADGQTAAPGEMFTLGDETCEFPGDPSLSDGQRINCLCWLELADGNEAPEAEVMSDE